MSTRIRTLWLMVFATLALLAPSTAVANARRAQHRDLARTAGRFDRPAGRVAPLSAVSSPFSGRLGDGGFGSSLVGSAPVGAGPAELAVDPATHTIYVTNGFNDTGNSQGGDTVSVIDSRHCDAQDVSRCKGPWPTITVGNLPSGVAIDEATHTVYVSDQGDNTVSVFNAATCNAMDTAGCEQTPATVPVGSAPATLYADPANDTIYVPEFGDTDVSMIDSATCNATDLATCPTSAAPTVDVGSVPEGIAIDQALHTVYVTTFGSLNGWTVFDANTCNAKVQSGCGTLGYLTGHPSGPNDAEVDPANQTLYTANFDNTISAFDLRACNAEDLAGCSTDPSGTVATYGQAGYEASVWLTVDVELHTVYAVYTKDDALVVVNTRVCGAGDLAGCATLNPPEVHTGTNPQSVALDARTQTLYVPNQLDNNVSVIDPSRCDAQTTIGCRPLPPAVRFPAGVFAGQMANAAAVATTYAPGYPNVDMINTRTCNTAHPAGCSKPLASIPAINPIAAAVDPITHTVYVTDDSGASDGRVLVIDDRTCNATVQRSCSTVSTMAVPGGMPGDVAVNPLTDTVYVATTAASGPNLISVINGATCNATTKVGCDQIPATDPFADSGDGPSAAWVAVDPATNTVYATNMQVPPNNAPYAGDTVYVINGAACDAPDTTGCADTPAKVSLGSDPIGIEYNPNEIAVDQATDTIYTANLANGEGPGTASVIDGAICNGQDISGCGQVPATATVGFGATGIAIDPVTNHVYVANDEDSSVSVIHGATCDANDTSGCDQTHAESVADYPVTVDVDPSVGTAYVGASGTISVIPLTP